MSTVPIRTRREFAGVLGGAVLSILGLPRPAMERCVHRHHDCDGIPTTGPHPDPRPGIDASRVLTADNIRARHSELIPLYDGIREIPHIVDGIRCPCGCAGSPQFRSLLICFESNGMALGCEICQTVGRLTVRYNGQGRSLDRIRAAIDARYG